jgi:uncharacterized protein YecT (DUF1311 family)
MRPPVRTLLGLSLALGVAAWQAPLAHGLSDQDYRVFLAQSAELRGADQALNALYKRLLSGLDEQGQATLRLSQQSWLKQRDALARDMAASQGLALPAAYAALARNRVAELQGWSARPQAQAPFWQGKWDRVGVGRFDEATLTISEATPLGFIFALEAMSGGNSGEVSGQAKVEGNRAWYEDEQNCRLDFSLAGGKIKVQGNEGCQYYAGNGVHFDGEYARAGARPVARPAPPSAEQKALAALAGKHYQLFLDTMQLEGEEQDLDGWGAKVRSYGVRGLFTAQESIIMYGARGRIWAAVIDGDEVRYFTNDQAQARRLPRTIEQWRERFADKQVIFMNGAAR